MKRAYIDSSVLVAIAFDESGATCSSRSTTASATSQERWDSRRERDAPHSAARMMHAASLVSLLRRGALRVALAITVIPVSLLAQPTPAPLTAAAIRAARARSNAAIAARDTATLAALASNSYHSVSSRNVHTNGRAGVGTQYAGHFAAHPDVSFVRSPQEVRVYTPWQMADERGTWVGTWTEPDGRVTIRGRYSAKWRRTNGLWLLEAEVFTPGSCTGSAYCRAAPDQPDTH